jgi:bacterioferritin-associated ferredoxin
MRIWIIDLRGAYTLLSFRPEDVGLFATLLSDDLVYLQMVGTFCSSCTPAAFQVITRAIMRCRNAARVAKPYRHVC